LEKIKKHFLVSALSLSILSTGVVAHADEGIKKDSVFPQKYKTEEHELINFFNNYDVPYSLQIELLEKLRKGKKWDSLNNEKAISKEKRLNDDGVEEIVSRFKDGSIVVNSGDTELFEFKELYIESDLKKMENIKNSPQGIVSGGTVTGGSGYKSYKKAKVYSNTGVLNASFYANFTLVQNGNDFISNAYDYSIQGKLGVASFQSLKIIKKTESLDGRAQAKLDFSYKAAEDVVNSTYWLKLYVGNDKYSSSDNY